MGCCQSVSKTPFKHTAAESLPVSGAASQIEQIDRPTTDQHTEPKTTVGQPLNSVNSVPGDDHRSKRTRNHLDTSIPGFPDFLDNFDMSSLSLGESERGSFETTDQLAGTEQCSSAEIENAVKLLKRNRFFRESSESSLFDFVKQMEPEKRACGSVLIVQEEPVNDESKMYLLTEGTIRLDVVGGDRKTLTKEGGWVFGEFALICKSYRTATITAITDCRLLSCSRPVLMALPAAKLIAFYRQLSFLKSISDHELFQIRPFTTFASLVSTNRVIVKLPHVVNPEIEDDCRLSIDGGSISLLRPSSKIVCESDSLFVDNNCLVVIRHGRLLGSFNRSGDASRTLSNGSRPRCMFRRGQYIGGYRLLTSVVTSPPRSTTQLESLTFTAEAQTDLILFDRNAMLNLNFPLVNYWLDVDHCLNVFSRLDLIKKLSIKQCNQETSQFERISHKSGEIVFAKGDVIGSLIILRQGSLSKNHDELVEPTTRVIPVFGTLNTSSTIQNDYVAVSDVILLRHGTNRMSESSLMEHKRRTSEDSVFRPLNSTHMDLSRIQIHKKIGVGSSGRVYLVSIKNTRPNQVFALKAISKSHHTSRKQVEHTLNELAMMKNILHPFCCRLFASFQDRKNLYLLQDLIPGGELFSHLEQWEKFPEDVARFYAANVLLALEHMHSRKIVYRDLKPENLLLDKDGYVVVADFGFAKYLGNDERTWTICGTLEYQAPEILKLVGTTTDADIWSFGILIYEMVTGDPPFKGTDPEIIKKVGGGRFTIPKFLSKNLSDLLYSLLRVQPNKRLGSTSWDDVKAHPWFAGINFDDILQKKLPPPIKPRLESAMDMSNFSPEEDADENSQSLTIDFDEVKRMNCNAFSRSDPWSDWNNF